jgi:hypothetical protein
VRKREREREREREMVVVVRTPMSKEKVFCLSGIFIKNL